MKGLARRESWRGKVYCRLLSDLRSSINRGNLRPGDWLLGENTLADIYGISRISVRKALAVLSSEGLIAHLNGKGSVIRQRSSEKLKDAMIIIESACLDIGLSNSYYLKIRKHLEICFDKAGIEIKTIIHSNKMNNGSFWKGLSLYKDTGVVLLAKTDSSKLPPKNFFKSPLIQIDSRLEELDADSIELDSMSIGRQMAEHLMELGHRDISFLDRENSRTLDPLKKAGIETAMKDSGIDLDSDLVVASPYKTEGTVSAIQKLLETGKNFSALICYSAFHARTAIAVLREKGKKVPEDVSVVAMGEDYSENPNSEQLTRIDANIPKLAEKAVGRLQWRFKNPEKARVAFFSSVKIIKGETSSKRGKVP